ncbi:MAG TPA: hypothetical protein DCX07_05075 [Phycisphaerales bacterium]|nr:hypothetical protein [Phycisphaerales bacterium]
MSTTLQADGPSGRFLVNGKPTFLLGASYYGGLALEPAETEPDLRELRGLGFNWVRLWCTWGAFGNDVAAMDDQGKAREPYLSRLVGFCALADRLGMIVDVTFSRGLPPDHAMKAPWLRSPLQTRPAYLEALRTVTDALRAYRNVYIDVVNERNTHRMPPVPFEEAAEMISLVRRIDPGRLATISDVYDIPDAEVAGYIRTAGVDFLTPHRVRTAESPAQTAENTRRYRRLAAEAGRPVPVHYQEPFRRDFTTWQPTAEDFLTDLAGAVEGGAAGWCFHNGFSRHSPDSRPRRSFDLRDGRLMEQLDDVERAVVNRCAALMPSWK